MPDLDALTQQLLFAAFVLGIAFGAVAQRSHFCTMGAVADVVSMGSFTRMRMWALAAGVAVLGFQMMAALGWVRPADSLYGGSRLSWLSAAVGGLMFGIGMVLASGCGSKTLVRVGGGSLKALVVALVMGLAAWATMRGVTAIWRSRTVDTVALDLSVGQDLPSWLSHALGGSAQAWAVAAGLLLGGGLIAWSVWSRDDRRGELWWGGLGIGALVLAAWALSGIAGHVAEHPDTLEPAYLGTASRRMEALSFVAPVALALELVVFASDASRQLSMGVAVVLGVVVGSAGVAIASGRFRWEGFGGVSDLALHLLGAVLMGVGGVTAMGCTIGQGLSGLSTLSMGSLIAVAAIVAGAVLAMRWQMWRLERMV